MSPFGPGLILGAKMLVSGRVLLLLLVLLRTTTTTIATATSTAITTGRIKFSSWCCWLFLWLSAVSDISSNIILLWFICPNSTEFSDSSIQNMLEEKIPIRRSRGSLHICTSLHLPIVQGLRQLYPGAPSSAPKLPHSRNIAGTWQRKK